MGVAMIHKSQLGEDASKDGKGADEMSIESAKATPGK
jgi:hypothetical protein